MRVPALARHFAGDDWRRCLNCKNALGSAGRVARAFADVACAFASGTAPPVAALHGALGRHNATFADYEQHDSHELLVVLLDALDEDLNAAPRARGAPRPPGLSGVALQEFCHDSIVSQTFHGFTRSTIQFDCGHVEAVDDPWASWTLPLPHRRSVTLAECAELWETPERLAGENEPHCDACARDVPASLTKCIWRFPPVLIVQLSRFEVGRNGSVRKDGVPVEYPLEFSAPDYEREPGREAAVYRLLAVIVHAGNTNGGHYTCVVKSNHRWFSISDAYVTEVCEQDAFCPGAYILFYERR
jgi:ubiquitin C-terminal hydrolase